MSESDPFLAAILGAPDDDLPRLIYADWLDERGDPARAEFILLQVELARLPIREPLRRRYLKPRATAGSPGTKMSCGGPTDHVRVRPVPGRHPRCPGRRPAAADLRRLARRARRPGAGRVHPAPGRVGPAADPRPA